MTTRMLQKQNVQRKIAFSSEATERGEGTRPTEINRLSSTKASAALNEVKVQPKTDQEPADILSNVSYSAGTKEKLAERSDYSNNPRVKDFVQSLTTKILRTKILLKYHPSKLSRDDIASALMDLLTSDCILWSRLGADLHAGRTDFHKSESFLNMLDFNQLIQVITGKSGESSC